MKNLSILLSIHFFLLLTGCASTCMEYRSATTAARSEKDLKRAEEWGLKALESPECNPSTDGYALYFLATEVYLQQKKYAKMAEMLTLAEQRNPDQPLENPFILGDTPVETIGEGVEAYRDQEWTKVYNKAVDYIQKDKIDKAKKKIETAILIHPKKGENYSTLATIYIENENIDSKEFNEIGHIEEDNFTRTLYGEFDNLWKPSQIKLISNLLDEANKYPEERTHLIDAINSIVDIKENQSSKLIEKFTKNLKKP